MIHIDVLIGNSLVRGVTAEVTDSKDDSLFLLMVIKS